MPRRAVGSLFSDGVDLYSHPVCCLAWSFSVLMDGARLFQNGTTAASGEITPMIILRTSASSVLPSQQATATPALPGNSPRSAGGPNPDSYGVPALPWDPVHVKPCALSKSRISVSPSPMEFLCSNLNGLQYQMPQGLPFSIPDPQVWKPDMGTQTLLWECLCDILASL